jgi:cytidine deaminase
MRLEREARTMKKQDGLVDPAGAARRAAGNAHAPYSGFRVGAVLEDSDGGLHPGCNVECASIGLSICAERAALAVAIRRGRRRFRTIWIYTPTAKPTPPCGACREMLSALAPQIEVVLLCDRTPPQTVALTGLLPGARGRSRR